MARLILLLVGTIALAVYLARIAEKRRLERLAQIRSRFLVAAPAPRAYGPELKEVALRSAAVSLKIPRHWSEEYPDEAHASFRDPASPERVLRLACATVPCPEGGLSSALGTQAATKATTVDTLAADRLLLKEVVASHEGSRDVLLFRWLLAVAGPSAKASVATFSLTLSEQVLRDPLIWDTLAMVELAVRASHMDAA
jgi:hypothetical protein